MQLKNFCSPLISVACNKRWTAVKTNDWQLPVKSLLRPTQQNHQILRNYREAIIPGQPWLPVRFHAEYRAHKPLFNFFYVAFLEIKTFLYAMDKTNYADASN